MTKRQNLDINQGETWSWTFTQRDADGSAVDLTGYTARMSVRDDLFGGDTVYLSTGADAMGGTITLGGVLGTVTLSMTAAQTDAMDETNYFLARYLEDARMAYGRTIEFLYDLELVSASGVVTRALEGFITFSRGVTSP